LGRARHAPEADASWPPGLCGSCVHARIVETARGSRFLLCDLSRTDPRFPRYPNLPVLRCAGYESRIDASDPGS